MSADIDKGRYLSPLEIGTEIFRCIGAVEKVKKKRRGRGILEVASSEILLRAPLVTDDVCKTKSTDR
jgi:hypothetical protein